MLRGTPGCRQIKPAFSRVTTIWCTAGPLTRKKRCISASAGGLPMTSVYAWMKARYCPWRAVKLGRESPDIGFLSASSARRGRR